MRITIFILVCIIGFFCAFWWGVYYHSNYELMLHAIPAAKGKQHIPLSIDIHTMSNIPGISWYMNRAMIEKKEDGYWYANVPPHMFKFELVEFELN